MDNQDNCQNRHEEITALVMGLLEPKAAEELKNHIETCKNCKKLYQAILDEEKQVVSTFDAIASKSQVLSKSISEIPNKTTTIIWSRIIRTPIVKLAAAAVVFIAVMIGINKTIPNFSMTSKAIAKFIENAKKMPWMHIIIEGDTSGEPDRLEGWISFEAGIYATTQLSGAIEFRQAKVFQKYDPTTDTITISYNSDDELEKVGSVSGYLDTILNMFNDAEAQIIKEKSKFQSREVITYNISGALYGTPMEVSMIVDAEKELLVFLDQKVLDNSGNITASAIGYFDYPDEGPQSIYEVGAPFSAKIIDNSPAEGVPEILEAYKFYKESAPSRFIAVVTDSLYYDAVEAFITTEASIVYRNGKMQRVNTYLLPPTEQEGRLQSQLQLKVEMGDSFESLIDWWLENGVPSRIDLYDGSFRYEARQVNDTWQTQPKEYALNGDLGAANNLSNLGWNASYLSYYLNVGQYIIIENDYTREHNVICLELTSQGHQSSMYISELGTEEIDESTEQILANPPRKTRTYLNPQRDYICQLFEQDESYDAHWQEDKLWLEKTEFDMYSTAISRVREVTEFGQTNTGKWYPKVIETQSQYQPYESDRESTNRITIKKIYLNDEPEFPEFIFDPASLPEAGD